MFINFSTKFTRDFSLAERESINLFWRLKFFKATWIKLERIVVTMEALFWLVVFLSENGLFELMIFIIKKFQFTMR